MISGYSHSLYADALSEFGRPLYLQRCGAWILQRDIVGQPYQDAMCLYPMLFCTNWPGLDRDLEELAGNIVSFAATTDPFGNYTHQELCNIFTDRCIPFKEHFVIDLQKAPHTYVEAHHLRNVRRALTRINVEISEEPSTWITEWCSLYDLLIERHNITSIARFSNASFQKQLEVPGTVAFKASHENRTVGMLLWYRMGSVAYYHLGAYNDIGYKEKASFALFNTAIQYFSDQNIKWLSLGAGAGVHAKSDDGLTRFKRGWSTGTRTAYFGGKILNHQRYDELSLAKHQPTTSFFPAYRLGEF